MTNFKCKTCGCDSFRVNAFREATVKIGTLICRNCSHTLTEHRDLPSVEQ